MIGQSSQKKALRLESEERLVFGDNTGRIGKVAEKSAARQWSIVPASPRSLRRAYSIS